MSELTVISGTRRAMKEMADGTLRVQIDIDPKFRAAFFAAFGQIDMPVAIAPLVADFEQRAPEPEKAKGGALARLAAQLGADPEFREFMSVSTADEAAEVIRKLCRVDSRAELDSNPEAEAAFHQMVRAPWVKYRASKGLK